MYSLSTAPKQTYHRKQYLEHVARPPGQRSPVRNGSAYGDHAMNITAVARKARVSTATVSRTINGSASVSPKTAERVHRAIKSLGFYPNVNARALGSGRSSLYGLIISDITNPFFPELVKAFEDVAVKHGMEVLVANTNYDPHRMENCVVRMLQRKVDGVAIMTSEMDEHLLELFSRRTIPVVFLDAGIVGPGVSILRVDYRTGIAVAIDHLTGLGHRRIGFISGPLRLSSALLRLRMFEAALLGHGIEPERTLVGEANHRIEGGKQVMAEILANVRREGTAAPTAIVCSNDLTAIGAMQAIAEAGLRIPEDISVVGCDDIQLSAYTNPALTTIGGSRARLGDMAFHALFDQRDGQGAAKGKELIFGMELVLRRSTAQPRTG